MGVSTFCRVRQRRRRRTKIFCCCRRHRIHHFCCCHIVIFCCCRRHRIHHFCCCHIVPFVGKRWKLITLHRCWRRIKKIICCCDVVNKKKKHPWRDSNPRSSAPETDALATGPQGRPPTGVWTQVFGVRIRRAHHYTIGGYLTSNDSNPQRPPMWAIHCKEASVTNAYIPTKTYTTCDSRVVPHRSTEQAQWCLTSEFGWDPVVSPWYERTMQVTQHILQRCHQRMIFAQIPTKTFLEGLEPPISWFVVTRLSHWATGTLSC